MPNYRPDRYICSRTRRERDELHQENEQHAANSKGKGNSGNNPGKTSGIAKEISDSCVFSDTDFHALLDEFDLEKNSSKDRDFFKEYTKSIDNSPNWIDKFSPSLAISHLFGYEPDEPALPTSERNDLQTGTPEWIDHFSPPPKVSEDDPVLKIQKSAELENSLWWKEFDFLNSPAPTGKETQLDQSLPEDPLSGLDSCTTGADNRKTNALTLPIMADDKSNEFSRGDGCHLESNNHRGLREEDYHNNQLESTGDCLGSPIVTIYHLDVEGANNIAKGECPGKELFYETTVEGSPLENTDELGFRLQTADELGSQLQTTCELSTQLQTTDELFSQMETSDELVSQLQTCELNFKLQTINDLGSQLQTTNDLGPQLQTTNDLGPQLQTTCELNSQLPTTDDLGSQLQTTNDLGPQLQTTCELNSQLPTTDDLGSQLQTTYELGSQLQITNDLGSQLQTTDELDSQLQTTDELGSQLQTTNDLGPQLQTTCELNSQLPTTDDLGSQLQTTYELGSQLQTTYELRSQSLTENDLGSQLQTTDELGPQLQTTDNLGSQLQTTDDLGSQLQTTNDLGPQLQTTCELNSQLPTTDDLGSQLQTTYELGSQLQTTNDLDSQLQTTYELGSQMQTTNELGSQLQTTDDLGSQLQTTDDLGSQLQTTNELGSQLQTTNELGSQLQTTNELGSQLQTTDDLGSQLQTTYELDSHLQTTDELGDSDVFSSRNAGILVPFKRTFNHDSTQEFSYTTTPTWESMVKLTPSIDYSCITSIFTDTSDSSMGAFCSKTNSLFMNSLLGDSSNTQAVAIKSTLGSSRTSTPLMLPEPEPVENGCISPANLSLDGSLEDGSIPYISPFLSSLAAMPSPLGSDFSGSIAEEMISSINSLDVWASENMHIPIESPKRNVTTSPRPRPGPHPISTLAPPKKRARKSATLISPQSDCIQNCGTPLQNSPVQSTRLSFSPSPIESQRHRKEAKSTQNHQDVETTPTKRRRIPSISPGQAHMMMCGFQTTMEPNVRHEDSQEHCYNITHEIEKNNAVEALLNGYF